MQSKSFNFADASKKRSHQTAFKPDELSNRFQSKEE